MGHYIHHVPGRLRIRTPKLKRDELRAKAAEQLLLTIPGIHSTRANTVTGSVTLTYQREAVNPKTILDLLERHGYYNPETVQHADGQWHDMAARTGDKLGKALFGMVVEKAIERSAGALIGALL
jgi:copper chaperone CopZ